QENAEMHKFEVLNESYIVENLKLAKLTALFMPLVQALIGLTFLIVLVAGGYQLLHHRISLGSFVMFNTYMGLLVWPMIALGWVVNLMQRGMASWDRIMELMHEQPGIAAKDQCVRIPSGDSLAPGAEVKFRNVQVAYPATRALNGVNLTNPAGSTIAIVGH